MYYASLRSSALVVWSIVTLLMFFRIVCYLLKTKLGFVVPNLHAHQAPITYVNVCIWKTQNVVVRLNARNQHHTHSIYINKTYPLTQTLYIHPLCVWCPQSLSRRKKTAVKMIFTYISLICKHCWPECCYFAHIPH